MNLYLVRLKFSGPVHPGHYDAGVGDEAVLPNFHSDTIFSAFCSAWALTEEGRKYIDCINVKDAPILFSSAFLFRQDAAGNNTYYLPRPLLPGPAEFGPWQKTVKNAMYITDRQFEKWAAGRIYDSNTAQNEGLGSQRTDFQNLYHVQVRPRQSTHRKTMAAKIYHCGEVFFYHEHDHTTGLYFLAFTRDEQPLLTALEVLQYYGMGGIRSAGYGKFTYELEGPLNESHRLKKLFNRPGGKHYCLLSLLYPGENEKNPDSYPAYNAILRKGWFYSSSTNHSLKRASLRMLGEGSIVNKKPLGIIADTAPEKFLQHPQSHPVYRYGLAMSVPVILPEGIPPGIREGERCN